MSNPHSVRSRIARKIYTKIGWNRSTLLNLYEVPILFIRICWYLLIRVIGDIVWRTKDMLFKFFVTWRICVFTVKYGCFCVDCLKVQVVYMNDEFVSSNLELDHPLNTEGSNISVRLIDRQRKQRLCQHSEERLKRPRYRTRRSVSLWDARIWRRPRSLCCSSQLPSSWPAGLQVTISTHVATVTRFGYNN